MGRGVGSPRGRAGNLGRGEGGRQEVLGRSGGSPREGRWWGRPGEDDERKVKSQKRKKAGTE